MFNLFKLVRINNVLLIIITQYLIRFCVIRPLLQKFDIQLQMSEFWFAMLVLSTAFIAAGGYAINDYFDTKTDLINRPERVLIGKAFSRKYPIKLHLLLSVSGILLGSAVAVYVGDWRLSVIFPIVVGLLWFYSTTYKGMLIVGNLIISLLVGLVPILVLMFELSRIASTHVEQMAGNMVVVYRVIYWVCGFALFAFLTNFIREVVKDMEDYTGDAETGRITIPIAWGMGNAKLVVILLSLLELLFIGTIALKYLYKIPSENILMLAALYVGFLIILPMVFLVAYLSIATEKSHFSKVSLLAKVVMLTGILFSVIFGMTVI